jgi:transposase-like protein
MSQTTWTELVAEYENLRRRHVELELEFKHLAAEQPVSVVAHRQLAGRLAVHRTNLRKWRIEFRRKLEASEACSDTDLNAPFSR